MITKAVSAEDYWSEAGISTLGMKNDTFEYGFSCGQPPLGSPNAYDANARLKTDFMSLSSLNEILDGPMDDDRDQEDDVKKSPRHVLPVIDVPNRPSSATRSRLNSGDKTRRKTLLGLISPKKLITPRKHQHAKKNKNSTATTIEQPIDEDEDDHSNTQSDAATSKSSAPVVAEQKPLQLRQIESNGSNSNSSTSDRYKPTQENPKVGLTLSTDNMDDEQEHGGEEWDDEVFQNNLIKLKSSTDQDEQSDWDDTCAPNSSVDDENSKHCEKAEPVGKTPKRNINDDIEMSLTRFDETEEKKQPPIREATSNFSARGMKLTPSGDVSAILDFDMGDQDDEDELQATNKKSAEKEVTKSPKSNPPKSKSSLSKSPRSPRSLVPWSPRRKKRDNEEMSLSTKSKASKGSRSEGSKTKIFGRIVDMMSREKQRGPLIPNAVVEKTYIVKASTSKDTKVDAGLAAAAHHGHKKQPRQKIHPKKTKHAISKDTKSKEKRTKQQDVVSKPAKAEQVQQLTEQKKSMAKGSSNYTVIDDSTTVIEKAIYHGNIKALQSNEEDDDTPDNYLALMLKKKAREERKRHDDCGSVRSSDDAKGMSPPTSVKDADSFAEAIRGPRHQECPGVALEGITQRNPIRDPSDGDSVLDGIRNLAPTPRRRGMNKKSLEDVLETANDLDPPLNDARERQRKITELLYGGNSSKDDSEENQNDDEQDPAAKSVVDHLETVPTVESSAASYKEGAKEDPIIISKDENDDFNIQGKVPSDENTKVNISNNNNKRSMNFLPGIFKLKA
jgi:hypothetical protein